MSTDTYDPALFIKTKTGHTPPPIYTKNTQKLFSNRYLPSYLKNSMPHIVEFLGEEGDQHFGTKRTLEMKLHTSWIGKFFCRFYDSVQADKDTLLIRKGEVIIKTIPYDELISFAKIKNFIFIAAIEVPSYDGTLRTIGWFNKKEVSVFCKFLNRRLKLIINSRIASRIDEFDYLTLVHYPRDSWEDKLRKLGNSLVLYKPYIEEGLIDEKNRKNLNRIFTILPIDLKKLRMIHEQEKLVSRKEFFDTIEKYPLTPEQRLGVLRSNDFNMVLAAAGTGKTSVIVSKIFDLIERGLCKPDEILVMAFNRAAAIEVKERFNKGVEKRCLSLESHPEISTFHALGRKILKEAGIRVSISVFAEDPLRLNQWITKWVRYLIEEDVDNFHQLLRFIPEPMDPFKCPNQLSYEKSIRDNEFRTMLGEKVRGYQEMLIANYLFFHGVPYKYEEPYVSKRRIEENIDYRPDFHLTGTDIYIEHFGIDRNGNTRPDVDKEKYNREMHKKRLLHKEHGTTLIETFHYEWKEGILEESLRNQLLNNGIILKELTQDTLKNIIENNIDKISLWGEILKKVLDAVRVENLDADGIAKRFEEANLAETKLKSILITRLLNDYKKELEKTQTIDFDDMILRSSKAIEVGKFKPKWKYVLVDEFQDISTSRMELVRKLVEYSQSPSLTVVGDDWQAIYRFAGGKLEFTTKFDEFVGNHSSTFLRKTFRYHDNIANVSEKFVTENPNQIKKNVEAHTHVDSSKIFLHDHFIGGNKDYPGKVQYIIEYLRKNDPNGSIAVIARYNYILNEIEDELKHLYKNVNYWTFHKSKGLEADHVILVGLTNGKNGFPSENMDEAMVAALLPLADDYPHSEERRLMYVGMTRPKYHLHIIADPVARSSFVEELLSAWYNINVLTPYFKKSYSNLYKCPYCVEGYLRKMKGQYGEFYVCSTGRGCPVGKTRVCEKCGAPSIDAVTVSKCTNPKCGYSFPICEVCGRPMRVRDGKFGKFLGCSGYGIKDDQCKNTRPLR